MDDALAAALLELYDRAETTHGLVAYLNRNGIDPGRLADFAGGHGRMPIYVYPAARFDFASTHDEEHEPVDGFALEVLETDGETPLDIIAWPVESPGTVLTMFGRAPLAGMWAAMNPASYYLGKQLAMHRTPFDWARSGCQGAAVAVPRLAGRALIDIPGEVQAADWAHARELKRLISMAADTGKVTAATQQLQVAA